MILLFVVHNIVTLIVIHLGDLAPPTRLPDTDAASPPRQVGQRRGASRKSRSSRLQWLEADRTSEIWEPRVQVGKFKLRPVPVSFSVGHSPSKTLKTKTSQAPPSRGPGDCFRLCPRYESSSAQATAANL